MSSQLTNPTAPRIDLQQFVPQGIGSLDNPQTDIPRIARDEKLAGLIDQAISQVPTTHTLYLGDSRSSWEVPPQSVHLVLTSPPYWTLKDYRESEGQLGHIADYDQFLGELDRLIS